MLSASNVSLEEHQKLFKNPDLDCENLPPSLTWSIKHTYKLQRQLTKLIGLTSIVHCKEGRTLQELNKERAILLNFRDHVEALLGSLLQIRKVHAHTFNSQELPLKLVEEQRHSLLEAGQAVLLELPENTGAYDTVIQVVRFVDNGIVLDAPTSQHTLHQTSSKEPAGDEESHRQNLSSVRQQISLKEIVPPTQRSAYMPSSTLAQNQSYQSQGNLDAAIHVTPLPSIPQESTQLDPYNEDIPTSSESAVSDSPGPAGSSQPCSPSLLHGSRTSEAIASSLRDRLSQSDPEQNYSDKSQRLAVRDQEDAACNTFRGSRTSRSHSYWDQAPHRPFRDLWLHASPMVWIGRAVVAGGFLLLFCQGRKPGNSKHGKRPNRHNIPEPATVHSCDKSPKAPASEGS